MGLNIRYTAKHEKPILFCMVLKFNTHQSPIVMSEIGSNVLGLFNGTKIQHFVCYGIQS